MTPEQSANEADVLEQLQEVGEADEPEIPPVSEVEANPADVHEQSMPVPAEEEDWPDA